MCNSINNMNSVNRDCPEYRECLVEQVQNLPKAGTVPVGKIEEWLQELSEKCDKSCDNIDDKLAQLERMSTEELDAALRMGSLKKRKKSKRKKKSKSSKKSKKSTKTKKSKTKSKKSKRVKRTKSVKRVKRSRTKRVKRGKRN